MTLSILNNKASNAFKASMASKASTASKAFTASSNTRVLIITYYWPPSGGAGVQRWLKFSKYMPQYGWEPIVLTVDPDYATFPAIDTSLEKEAHESIKVFRTKARDWFRFYTRDKSRVPSAGFASNKDDSIKGKFSRFIRGNLFIPDPRRGWNKYAFKKACEIIREFELKHVITTSPPHSTQLTGLRLKRLFPEIKWIADLRDTWTDIYYYDLFYPTTVSKAIDRHYEKMVLKKADQIITVGNNLANTFISKTEGISVKMHIIPNGYDEDDFKNGYLSVPERFTITYVGTLSEIYPMDGLLRALAKVEDNGFDFLLRFAGLIPEEIKHKINSFISSSRTDFIPYLPHAEAIRLMCGSSMLLLITPDTKKNNAITPGKVFEYLATGKPVLYIGPSDGDAAFHLKQCGYTGIFSGENHQEMADYIMRLMSSPEPASCVPAPGYSRRVLTEKLAGILDRLNT